MLWHQSETTCAYAHYACSTMLTFALWDKRNDRVNQWQLSFSFQLHCILISKPQDLCLTTTIPETAFDWSIINLKSKGKMSQTWRCFGLLSLIFSLYIYKFSFQIYFVLLITVVLASFFVVAAASTEEFTRPLYPHEWMELLGHHEFKQYIDYFNDVFGKEFEYWIKLKFFRD